MIFLYRIESGLDERGASCGQPIASGIRLQAPDFLRYNVMTEATAGASPPVPADGRGGLGYNRARCRSEVPGPWHRRQTLADDRHLCNAGVARQYATRPRRLPELCFCTGSTTTAPEEKLPGRRLSEAVCCLVNSFTSAKLCDILSPRSSFRRKPEPREALAGSRPSPG